MITEQLEISSLENGILQVLAYHELFSHPLDESEIAAKLPMEPAQQNIQDALNSLVASGVIHVYDGFYTLKDVENRVKIRKEGEIRASRLLKKARYMSKLIYAFPFVRAVLISGSLSKGSVPEDSDIDYFIITKKNRLWISRTLLVLFKRVFLLNSKKYFCVNYFVDEENLEIPDKNIFTATEVSTLLPVRGTSYYRKFMEANVWFRDFYPNAQLPQATNGQPGKTKKVSQALLEPLFFDSLAESLDKTFMRKTYKRWMRIYNGGYSEEEFELAFRSRRGTSKNHNKNYQKRVLDAVDAHMEQALQGMKKEVVNG